MKALVTGATGFVGRRLCQRLATVAVLSRSAERARRVLPDATVFEWDPVLGPPPADAFDDVDVVFHLLGEPVAGGLWTRRRRARIRDSRVLGTRHLVEGIDALDARPRALVSASAVGYYGSRGDAWLEESAARGEGFLADVCRAWEAECAAVEALGVRGVSVRTGLVLGTTGGALVPVARAFRYGLGGRLGTGRQWMPWIHIDDHVELMLHAADHAEIHGAVNSAVPEPATNAEFTRTLASVLHRPAFAHVPAFVLRLVLGEMSEVLLSSQRVRPAVALETGYDFRYTDLEEALRNLLGE